MNWFKYCFEWRFNRVRRTVLEPNVSGAGACRKICVAEIARIKVKPENVKWFVEANATAAIERDQPNRAS